MGGTGRPLHQAAGRDGKQVLVNTNETRSGSFSAGSGMRKGGSLGNSFDC